MAVNAHLHLLIDDHEILYRSGLTRVVEVPQRVALEPVLRPQTAWEGDAVSLWGSVYREDDELRMWYLGTGGEPGPLQTSICYATSSDGRNWTRGDFDLWPYPDAPRNNIVFRDDRDPPVRHTHPFTVLLDPQDADPARRHKLVAFFTDSDGGQGYLVAFSADGIHWMPEPGRLQLPRGDRTSVLQDFFRGGFAMFTRGDHRGRDRRAGMPTQRDITISRSPDLLEWTPTSTVFYPDDDDRPGSEFYGMPAFCWGNQYIGLLEIYDRPNEVLNVQLATSRDGDHWERAVSRRTYFDVGSSDAWDSTWVAFGMTPPVVVGDEMLMWYTGRPVAHRRADLAPLSGAIGLARAPRDRFAGLRAGPDGGELTTDWIEIGAARLLLNIGAANGPLSVAVTGDDALPLPGFGHDNCDLGIEAGVDVEATWNGHDLAELVGRRVRLHIRLTYSTLYAYRFA